MKIYLHQLLKIRSYIMMEFKDWSTCHLIANLLIVKWVLKVKCKIDRLIDKFKGRLVATRYAGEKVEMMKRLSPVMRFCSFRLMLAILAHFNLRFFQMNVEITFLNE